MRLLIREIRLQRGMTLKELGEAIGKKPHTVWEYENHKTRIAFSVLYDIAKALDVCVCALFTEDAPGSAPMPRCPTQRVHALPPARRPGQAPRRRGSRAPH